MKYSQLSLLSFALVQCAIHDVLALTALLQISFLLLSPFAQVPVGFNFFQFGFFTPFLTYVMTLLTSVEGDVE